ncbi:MAG: M28 family peptidase [Planctomycetes bacterium]|nr:M28 family peptidase [Planctomycetota bacterium]
MRPNPASLSRTFAAFACLAAGGALLACADGAGQSGGSRSDAALGAEAQLFDEAKAWAHLEALVAIGPRPAGSGGAVKTVEYLETQLKSYGLTPVRESFIARATPAGDVPMCNLYVDLPAAGESANKAPLIVIGSHFDTKRFEGFAFVGANDGGSSTAVLLELARVLSLGGPRKAAYRLLFIDGEEAIRTHWEDPDNRYGSRHHVEQLKSSGLLTRVKAFVLLDLVGDKDLRINRDRYSDVWLYECFAAPARAAGMSRFVDGRAELIADDHVSFLEAGVPSVDLIDFDYGPGNSWWHTPQDTLDKCSPKSLGAIGRITLMGLPNVERRLLGK